MTSWICLRHGISSYRSFADNSLIQKDSVVPFDRILLSLFCRYRDIAIDSDNSHEGLFDGYEITSIHIQKYVNELAEYGYGLSTIKKQMRKIGRAHV